MQAFELINFGYLSQRGSREQVLPEDHHASPCARAVNEAKYQ